LIVLDASALLELLLGTARAAAIGARALSSGEDMHAPHLLDVEIVQALRRLVRLEQITVIERHPHRDLLPRIWQLRESMTAYDGAYIALAEALDAPLLTCDARLGRSHGHGARIEVAD
jgi:predicted nucleic acid-binding protein